MVPVGPTEIVLTDSPQVYGGARVFESHEERRILSRKSLESLNPGGRLIIHEVLYNKDKTGPFAAAAYTMMSRDCASSIPR